MRKALPSMYSLVHSKAVTSTAINSFKCIALLRLSAFSPYAEAILFIKMEIKAEGGMGSRQDILG